MNGWVDGWMDGWMLKWNKMEMNRWRIVEMEWSVDG